MFLYRSHDPYEVSMNFLMSMALEKVAYLPFAFMVDQVRYYMKYNLHKTQNRVYTSINLNLNKAHRTELTKI